MHHSPEETKVETNIEYRGMIFSLSVTAAKHTKVKTNIKGCIPEITTKNASEWKEETRRESFIKYTSLLTKCSVSNTDENKTDYVRLRHTKWTIQTTEVTNKQQTQEERKKPLYSQLYATLTRKSIYYPQQSVETVVRQTVQETMNIIDNAIEHMQRTQYEDDISYALHSLGIDSDINPQLPNSTQPKTELEQILENSDIETN